jgi:carbonic anhydrase/acetyltransferase-like protein (isoleucine patch superfamily)
MEQRRAHEIDLDPQVVPLGTNWALQRQLVPRDIPYVLLDERGESMVPRGSPRRGKGVAIDAQMRIEVLEDVREVEKGYLRPGIRGGAHAARRCTANLLAMTSIRSKSLKRIKRRWRGRGDVRVRLKTAAIKLANRDIADQPVWVGRNGRLEREDGAILQLGGWLVIGDYQRRSRKKKKKKGRGIRQTIGPPPSGPAILKMYKASRLETKGWVHMAPGTSVVIGPRATVTLADSTFFSGGTLLCTESIEIGRGCAIGWDVTIMDSDMHPLVVDGKAEPATKPIRIGDHVWIGAGARILKGVTIGEGAIVAAGAIVTKDVEPQTLVGGVPAQTIRKGVDWQ